MSKCSYTKRCSCLLFLCPRDTHTHRVRTCSVPCELEHQWEYGTGCQFSSSVILLLYSSFYTSWNLFIATQCFTLLKRSPGDTAVLQGNHCIACSVLSSLLQFPNRFDARWLVKTSILKLDLSCQFASSLIFTDFMQLDEINCWVDANDLWQACIKPPKNYIKPVVFLVLNEFALLFDMSRHGNNRYFIYYFLVPGHHSFT